MVFDDRKERMIRLPLAPANEKFVKSVINKLEIFTNYSVKFNMYGTPKKLSLYSIIKTK